METSKLVAEINRLNSEGIKLSRPATFDRALECHQQALALAMMDDQLNPDYMAVSAANIGYITRQRGDYHVALDLLEGILAAVEEEFSQGRRETFSGRGRLLEEMALVIADLPTSDKEERVKNIKKGIKLFNQAIDFYNQALDSHEDSPDCCEIYTFEEILRNRKLRIVGARAPKATDLYGLTSGEESEGWRDKALRWAMEEVQLREKELEETEGHGLANAYHTLGYVLTEYVGSDNALAYQAARDTFEKAAKVPGIAENSKAVINFCLSWLEHKKDPKNKFAIGKEFDRFLSSDLDKLTEANKNALIGRIDVVADSLGEEYKLKVVKMFQGYYLAAIIPSS